MGRLDNQIGDYRTGGSMMMPILQDMSITELQNYAKANHIRLYTRQPSQMIAIITETMRRRERHGDAFRDEEMLAKKYSTKKVQTSSQKPIYRYDFDPDTGVVSKTVVLTDYERRTGGHNFSYNDPFNKILKYIDAEDFDKFANNRVYLWEDNREEAIRLIKEGLEARVSKTYSAYIKAVNVLNTLKEEIQ